MPNNAKTRHSGDGNIRNRKTEGKCLPVPRSACSCPGTSLSVAMDAVANFAIG